MAPKNACPQCGTRGQNGNCPGLLPDQHAVQCVGDWAAAKHHYINGYIEATHAARAKFISPVGSGGAAFVDLFAGPGKARIRENGQVIDGSPLMAMNHAAAPFTDILLCDSDSQNVSALRHRTAADARTQVFEIDSNTEIAKVVACIPREGLNIALVDPFAASALKWTAVEVLARVKRMDLIVNFATGVSIKRNYLNAPGYDRVIDEMLPPSADWRSDVTGPKHAARLIEHFRAGLVSLGYDPAAVRSIPIMQGTNVPMYHLVFASKKALGAKIWNSIAKSAPTGQRELF